MLGHDTITLSLDIYRHLVPVLHAQAVAAMDALFGLQKVWLQYWLQ